ncbi:histidine triad protein [Spiroplasma helicoides]|uniref:Histidine triad protein n=1 Tax=Spiroplasma helicoides TaxID=216938 RepID=A0A1B3SLA7_9MOLU|nr:HIT domain-containing protein [Spiroplasma helicoides]AOG60697.1 histidine triad protein [Spiroplasma helicoides]
MENCIFCKIANGEVKTYKIYENDYVVSFLDANPNSEGHCLVVPKKHSENFEQTDEQYLVEVAKAKKEIVKLLKSKLKKKPVGFNYVSNQGVEAYQTVFHYHEHIIPKYVKEHGYGFSIKRDPNDEKDFEVIHKWFL